MNCEHLWKCISKHFLRVFSIEFYKKIHVFSDQTAPRNWCKMKTWIVSGSQQINSHHAKQIRISVPLNSNKKLKMEILFFQPIEVLQNWRNWIKIMKVPSIDADNWWDVIPLSWWFYGLIWINFYNQQN